MTAFGWHFQFFGRRPLRFLHWCSLFSPHIPNYLIARSCKSSTVLENGERKWPKIGNVILTKFACFNTIRLPLSNCGFIERISICQYFIKKLYGISKIGCEWIRSCNFMILRIVQSGHVNCPFFEIVHFVLCVMVCVT